MSRPSIAESRSPMAPKGLGASEPPRRNLPAGSLTKGTPHNTRLRIKHRLQQPEDPLPLGGHRRRNRRSTCRRRHHPPLHRQELPQTPRDPRRPSGRLTPGRSPPSNASPACLRPASTSTPSAPTTLPTAQPLSRYGRSTPSARGRSGPAADKPPSGTTGDEVATERHLRRAACLVPPWWGIVGVSEGPRGGLRFRTVRRGARNPGGSAIALARLLWRDELLAILRHLGVPAKRLRCERSILHRALTTRLSRDELAHLVRSRLKARAFWRDPARAAPHEERFDLGPAVGVPRSSRSAGRTQYRGSSA